MEKLLICIDDTDNLDSIGTGQLLETMCVEMKTHGLAEGGYVTRHQLLIHEDIAYTSHNSSMCCELTTEDPEQTLEFARSYLEEHAAPGSDPGLCVLRLTEGTDYSGLAEFGRLAQTIVLKKEDAYLAADSFSGTLSLSEHGGTGDGVIGALAGVGLRLTGSDGRIKGKIFPDPGYEITTPKEICQRYPVDQVIDERGSHLPSDLAVRFTEPAKAILLDGKVTLQAEQKENEWRIIPHKGRKK